MRASSAMSRVMSALLVMITIAQPRMLGEHLEDAARHLELSLGRLVRIGGGADHDRFALEQREMLVAAVAERAREHAAGVALDEDVSLEGEPGRDALDLRGGAVERDDRRRTRAP